MKKILLVLFMLLMVTFVKACDICGCGVGNFNPHMFPHLSKNFIGIGYSFRQYHSHAHDDLGNELANTEYYRTLLLTGQVVLNKKMQLMALLPYQMNRQTGPEGNKSLDKMGDAVLLYNYRVFDKLDKDQLRQTIIAGAGIKLPTGSYQFDDSNEKEVGNANFQAGSGSTDWLLNGSYNIRYKKIAATLAATYKINGSNPEEYRFGNRFLGIAQFKYVLNIGNFSLIPNTGIQYEKMQADKSGSATVDHTGGFSTQFTGGIDINTKKWAIGFSLQQPLSQNLGEDHIHAHSGGNLHLSFSL